MGCGGFTCSKNALVALNVLYILVALILISVAAYCKVIAVITSISLMSGIIACGVFLLLIAFVGLIGAIKHHQVMLFFYMIILFLIFLVQFSVACACLAVNKQQQKSIIHKGWNKAGMMEIKSQVQKTFHCCGFESSDQDEVDPAVGMAHPLCGTPQGDDDHLAADLDCCKNSNAVCCIGHQNHTSLTEDTSSNSTDCHCAPCWVEDRDNKTIGLEHKVDDALKISGGIGLFFSFTEIFGVWITVRYRNQKDPRANPSAFLAPVDPVISAATLLSVVGMRMFDQHKMMIIGVVLALRYRNQKDPRANPSAFL